MTTKPFPEQVRKPRNIDYAESSRLQSRVFALGMDIPPGYELYVTASRIGRFRVNSLTCTVPLWATKHDFKKNPDPEFEVYYAAHELAHAWVYFRGETERASHGANFYKEFKRLCPPNLWHHELGYKKREATKAGISIDPAKNANRDAYDTPARDTQAADPLPLDLSELVKRAIKKDPRIRKPLMMLPDREKKSYIRGWFIPRASA